MTEDTPKGFGYTPIGKVKIKRAVWLIKDVLPKGIFAFISGKAKAGKSTLALHLANCLTKKKSFLGQYPIVGNRRLKVLLFSLEDHPGETKAKIKHMLKGKRYPKNLFLSNANAVTLPTDCDKIEQDIIDSKADVVILDTLRRSHGSDENSSSDMAPILNRLRMLIRRSQSITLIVIHHTGHDVKSPDSPDDWLRGTSDYNAVWETLICLEKASQHTNKVRIFHKYRSPLETSYKVVKGNFVDKPTSDFPIVDLVFTDSYKETREKNDGIVIEALNKQSVSGNKLEEMLKGKLSRPEIDASLERLNNKGIACRNGKGKNMKWHLTNGLRPS